MNYDPIFSDKTIDRMQIAVVVGFVGVVLASSLGDFSKIAFICALFFGLSEEYYARRSHSIDELMKQEFKKIDQPIIH